MPKLNTDTLSEDRLKNAVDRKIFDQGHNLYQWGRVQVREIKDQAAFCTVQDRHPFDVEIRVSGSYLYLKCTCRFAMRGVVCEHEIAACLAVREVLRQRQPAKWRAQVNKLIESWQTKPKRSAPSPYFLFFSLQEVTTATISSWKITPYQIPLSALPKEQRASEMVREEDGLAEFVENNPGLIAQIKSPYSPLDAAGCLNCSYESVMLANILIERGRSYLFFNAAFPLEDYLALVSSTNSPLFFGDALNPLQKSLKILPQEGQIRLRLDRTADYLRISPQILLGEKILEINTHERPGQLRVILNSPLWVLLDRYLFKIKSPLRSETISSFLEAAEILIPVKDENEFLKKHYLPLAEQVPLVGDLVAWELINLPPIPRVYLSDSMGEIQAQLKFGYGDYELPYDLQPPEESLLRKPNSWTLVRIQRNAKAEADAMRALASPAYGLKRATSGDQPGVLYLRARIHPVDFLLHKVPLLAKDGFEVYGEERLKTARVNRNKPSISFIVSSGIDWFDIRAVVNFGELEVALKDIRRAFRRNERYIKLADGTIGEIPQEWFERYKHLFALGEESQEGLRLSRHQITLLDQALDGSEEVKTDAAFEQQRQLVRKFTGIVPRPLPKGFKGELRPYQKAGYDWLHFLHEYGYGGCLADDMGLGKTIQALAFFESLREGSNGNQVGETNNPESPASNGCKKASLLVVPRSLLVNWQREAARFTPNLRILEYFDAERPKDLSVFDQTDLVITTYGVLLRDIHLLCRYNFHYVLLDESQVIKNPHSQTARAARLLNAQHRLVLTGTPVENSTLELWSQFAFLNPGLLGNLDYFREQFSVPIEKKNDETTAQLLRKLVFPFILRRTKDQVAPELPPRSERLLYCDMEVAQRKLYNRTRDYYRGMLLGLIEKEGMNNSRMKILEGLLRLRQISNHPRLVDDKFRGESGKFELLLETLETLRAEGHKALVFSQFVSMLRLVQNALNQRKIPYNYLDGHTKNRQEQVDTFQNSPEIPFFLISLKAGGLGLNLTAADYVIHIDPWWNPAVETQAADRTHRIGQDKPVFIFKLITRDSVEEKILTLQERKKNLVDQIITTESSFFKSLTEEDIDILFN